MNTTPPAAAKLAAVFRSYLLPVFLGDIRPPTSKITANATAFIFKPADSYLLVTAAHVYGAALKQAECGSSPKVGVGTCRIALSKRLVGLDEELDIATFQIHPSEARDLGAEPVALGRSGWPPPPPNVGDFAVLAGFPGQERKYDESGTLNLGIYTSYLKIADVGPRHISLLIDNAELEPYEGLTLPPQGYDLGGLSGGPVLSIESGPVLSWRLCGVTKQQSCLSIGDLVQVARADYITSTGEIVPSGA